jgi:hypothetical protein
MNYFDIANSQLAYVMASVIIIAVIIQTIIFIKKGWNRALDLGIDRDILIKSVKNSISLSILPSIPIVLGIIILVPLLGIPVPWLRLSVIGSPMFEMLAADFGAKAAGVSGLGGEGFNSAAFINSVWVMSIGGVSALLFSLIFIKPISTSYEKAKKRDGRWMIVFGNASLAGILATALAERLSTSLISALVVASSFIFVMICTRLSTKIKFLKDYSLTFGMIFGMGMAVLFNNLI